MNVRLMLTALYLVSAYVFAQPDVIKLTNGEWPPYLSKSLPNGGPSSQVIVEAYKHQGIDVIWGWYPWQRSYVLAEEGQYDGTVIWSENKKRQAAFLYTLPILEDRRVFFHLVDKVVNWHTLSDLSEYEIGGTIGYEYSDEFQEAEQQGVINVQRIAKEVGNFKKLLANRVDLVVATESVGYALIRNSLSVEEAKRITHARKPIDTQKWSVLISNNSPHQRYFVEQFNLGLEKLIASGRYEEIMKDAK
ncbi:substrate-binding periplasmic protein [Vibrio neptunius]|uniref:substrate-binding periplasmic protein n=1 Tax=Vibrio neptunius TaxID=170651 RepID=UPI0019CF5DE4|nr:transporter substrate-binding domain-containing protein [Vibrio neptunius]MBN3571534.1 transporter substrate-binding domain-containing protein [Vibrio neptunius]